MKKFLPLFLIAFFALVAVGKVNAQCNPDTTVGLGIHPEIPDTGCVGQVYEDTVTFVFPADTLYGGFTVPFDSFVVGAVNNTPSGLSWECDQMANGCTYYTNPPNLTRGCVRIYGTPDSANTAADSVQVVGSAWITVFGFPVEIQDTFNISLRVFESTDPYCNSVGIKENLAFEGVKIVPNPVDDRSVVRFDLNETNAVTVEVVDMMGRVIGTLNDGTLSAGRHEFGLFEHTSSLNSGIYFVRVRSGNLATTRKFVVTQ